MIDTITIPFAFDNTADGINAASKSFLGLIKWFNMSSDFLHSSDNEEVGKGL